jgi:hypothetical protein
MKKKSSVAVTVLRKKFKSTVPSASISSLMLNFGEENEYNTCVVEKNTVLQWKLLGLDS